MAQSLEIVVRGVRDGWWGKGWAWGKNGGCEGEGQDVYGGDGPKELYICVAIELFPQGEKLSE